MRTLAWALLGFSAIAAAACGGATTSGVGPSSSVTGQAGGQAIPTTDTIGLVHTQTSTAPNGATLTETSVEVAITNIPGTCSILQRHSVPPNATALSFGVTVPGASVATGTYAIGHTTSIATNAGFGTTDAKCASKTNEQAASGTITLTTISKTTINGSFDVKMDNGDHLTGTFDAPVCDVVISPNNPPAGCGS